MLPTEKSVSVVSGVAGERIAAPETPVQVEPSGNTIAAETPGYLPPLRMPFREAWRAVAFAGSRLAANELGAASREVGTGTIEMFGVAVGELDAGERVRHREQRLLQPVCDTALRLKLADVLQRDAELVANGLIEGDLVFAEDALRAEAKRDDPVGPVVRRGGEGDQPEGLCRHSPGLGAARWGRLFLADLHFARDDRHALAVVIADGEVL